jgi:hypothetical protein
LNPYVCGPAFLNEIRQGIKLVICRDSPSEMPGSKRDGLMAHHIRDDEIESGTLTARNHFVSGRG